MAIKRFFVIAGIEGNATNWLSFLESVPGMPSDLEVELVNTVEQATENLLLDRQKAAATAICLSGADTAAGRTLKDSHPDFNVVLHDPNYPQGEVLVVMPTHFSAQPLIRLVLAA